MGIAAIIVTRCVNAMVDGEPNERLSPTVINRSVVDSNTSTGIRYTLHYNQ